MSNSEGVTDIAKDVWKNNKPLAIAVIVIAAAIAYILYRKSQSSAIAASAPLTGTPQGAIGPGGTFTTTYDTTTINNPTTPTSPTPAPPIPKPQPGPVQTIFPAPKGTIHPSPPGAGNNDTNWFPSIIPQRMTLAAAAQRMAKWNSASQLYNYRNNAAIFQQMGVSNNPQAMVTPGWSISV